MHLIFSPLTRALKNETSVQILQAKATPTNLLDNHGQSVQNLIHLVDKDSQSTPYAAQEGTSESSQILADQGADKDLVHKDTFTSALTENTFFHTHKLLKTKEGSCIYAIYDPCIADRWIEENYDCELLLHIREQGIQGPYACMLCPCSASGGQGEGEGLVLFMYPIMNIEFMARELMQVSGFPVVVRPIGGDPLLMGV
jgi:hypothetical protein